MSKKLSKVEIDGIEALLYDYIMQIITGFSYNNFLRKVIENINISANNRILDLGCGTGKTVCTMRKYTNDLIVAFDTSINMIKQAKSRCRGKNVKIFYHDIRKPHVFENQFDIVFISFVLHGLIDPERDLIIQNAYDSLKENGKFCVLDYSEFDLEKQNILIKSVFKYGECPLASEFIKINLKNRLQNFGFKKFEESYYYFNYVRLLIAHK